MMSRGDKPTPTLLQHRAVELLKEEILKPTNKSMREVLEDAGYAPATAKQWTNIMEGIRPHLQPTLDWMGMHRTKIMAMMDEHIVFATYDELRKSLEAPTHGIQLLGGKPNANIAIAVEHRQHIDALIED
jgi:hypothetical protein